MIRIGMFIDDRYEIIERIGSGGMSDVYKARCHKLNRYVAIKFLKAEYSKDKNFVSNFKIEAQSAAALLHPNVVSVYDVSEYDGLYYIVMEYVDGITLKDYIDKNGRLPVKEATSIAIQVGLGIEAAHNANIVHRDIKPQNVLISREGKIKVTDFGIARTTTANTMGTDVLGSVHYISPEQARGGVVDERTDIYSFGIMFYEMVTGELPYTGDSTVTVALKHIQETVPLVSDVVPNVPSSIVKIIEKCTQKKPERRYQKISSLVADLKTSLVNPNEDFVVLEPEAVENATILMSGQEARYIQSQGNRYDRGNRQAPERMSRNDMGRGDYRDGTGRVDYRDSSGRGDYRDGSGRGDYRGGQGRGDYRGDTSRIDYRNSGKDPSKKKFDKLIKIAGIAAAIIVVIVLLIVCINTFGKGCGGNQTETTKTVGYVMPNVVGKTLEEAKTALKDFTNVTVEYKEDSSVEENKVISQSVKEGEKIEKTTAIKLVVSKGKGTVVIPDCTDKTLTEMQMLLKNLGLVTTVETVYDETAEAGKVIKTSPKAGETVKVGSTVIIYVSKGTDTKYVKVPSLVGLTEDEAIAALSAKNLGYFVEREETTDKDKVGKVIRQDIREDVEVEEWTVITIYVGKEAETTTEAPTTTQAPTEPPTEPPTDPPTEPPTEAPTN